MLIAGWDADVSYPGDKNTSFPNKRKRPASLETGLSDRCLLIRGTALRYSAPAFAGFRANGAGLQPESGEHVHG